MSSVAQRPLTAEELWQLPVNESKELVRGEVIENIPSGAQHGAIALALGTLLHLWAKEGVGGYVGVEAGFVLARDPDIVRAPDVCYVSADRIPSSGVCEAFWAIAPDLAIDIVSPGETVDDVRGKIRDYLAAGTRLVWTVHPRTREVVVHTPDGMAQTYSGDDVIEYPAILPGFSCKVAELFD